MTVSPPVTPVAPARVDPAQLIDGTWTALDDQPGGQTSPATISRAVTAAWRDHRDHLLGIGTPAARAAALHAAAGRLDALAEEIAVQDTLDSGVPVAVTRLFAGSLGGTLRAAAGRIPSLAPQDLSTDGREVRLHHLPLGPAAILAPWNAPTAIAAKKAAFAWAAGCPVIIKPSPWSPSGTTVLARALHEAACEAGLPRASIQLVFGGAEAGQALISSPRIRALSFTGSRAGGRAVAATAMGEVPALHFELGSNNPALVLPDADIDATAAALASGMVKLNGAWCESPGTVFVPAGLRDELVNALVRQLEKQVIGDPFDESVTFGPQANPAQAEAVRTRVAQFARSGARVVTAGVLPALGANWVAPTLVVDPPAELARDETFGPVLVIRTTAGTATAIDQAHELATGLTGYVFTRDPAAGQRVGAQLPAGEVKINGTSLLDMSDASAQAFWYGSGVGGHGDADLLRFFTGARVVGEDADAPI